jgi:putative membrane protein
MKFMTRMAMVLLGVFALAGPAGAGGPPSTAEVLGKIHSANVREYRMGKMAREYGRAREVRTFGQTLIQDHDAADEKVVQLAKEEGITLAAHTPEVGPLKMPMGAAFDAAFSRDMLVTHRKDVAAVKAARDATQDEKLRSLLTDILPVLQKHEETAQQLVDLGSKS